MADTYNGRKRIRKQFGSIGEVAEMPNLIEVQKSSYDDFLMVKEPPGGRTEQGLQAVFKSGFPISDFSGRATLDFQRYEFDAKDIVYVRIDRRRKLPVTTLLYALGMDDEEILASFYKTITVKESKRGWKVPFVAEKMRGMTPSADLVDAKSGEVVAKAGEKMTAN